MKLNKNSWHYNLYQFWWRSKPTNNFCDYFWSLLLIIPTLPFVIGWMGYTIWVEDGQSYEHKHRNSLSKSWYYMTNTFIIPFIGAVLGGLIGVSIFYWKVTLITISLISIVGITLMLLKDNDIDYMIKEKVKSTKQNYCPQINWKD